MVEIEWTSEFSISVDLVDEQHKRLISLYNELIEAHKEVLLGDDRVGKALMALSEYISYHFEAEENLMKEVNYPEYESHHQIHVNLTLNVMEHMNNYLKNTENLKEEILHFLRTWITTHIMETDKKFGDFYKRLHPSR